MQKEKEKDMTNEEWLDYQEKKRKINEQLSGFAFTYDNNADPEDELSDHEYSKIISKQ